jgi:hypothetical protein
MPIPFGHCGQLMSAPSTGPWASGVGRSGTVIVGLAGTDGETGRLAGGLADPPTVEIGAAGAVGVDAVGGVERVDVAGVVPPAQAPRSSVADRAATQVVRLVLTGHPLSCLSCLPVPRRADVILSCPTMLR